LGVYRYTPVATALTDRQTDGRADGQNYES